MISCDEVLCPKCAGNLKYYDKVKRIARTKRRVTTYIEVRRFICIKCESVHRELPDSIMSYKQYEVEIIRGVLEGLITSDTLGFENYPCEMTMMRWRTLKASSI